MLTILGGGGPYQPLDDNGVIVPLGKLTFWEAGSSTLLDTYSDSDGATRNTNPVVLDANGRAVVYLGITAAYDIQFTDPNDVLIWFQPNVVASAPAI